jgi:hypothetical protein
MAAEIAVLIMPDRKQASSITDLVTPLTRQVSSLVAAEELHATSECGTLHQKINLNLFRCAAHRLDSSLVCVNQPAI